MVDIRLNKSIDPDKFARIYAKQRYVQIPDLLEPQSADALEQVFRSLPWRLVVQDDNLENLVLTREQVASLTPQQIQHINAGMRDRAARNLGFTYLTYPMIDARIEGWDPGHPIHDLTDFLNTPEFIEFAGRIIRTPGVNKVDCHASNYQAGSYLTRHYDDGMMKERRAAYTFGLTRKWEPDWGGLLMFLDDNHDVHRALMPRFNVLTVFDGLLLHSVSPVSPFCPAQRFSVAGWFRDDPIPGRS